MSEDPPVHPQDAAAREIARLRAALAQSEGRAQASEERYRLVNAATNDVIWDWDLITNELRWNDSIQTVFGHPLSLLGPDISSWYDYVHPEDRDRVVAGLHEAVASGASAWRDEYRFKRRDGTYATVLDRGHITRDDSGRGIRMIGSMLDLTDRLEIENALRQSERRVRHLADAMPQIAWIADGDGTVTYFNRRVEEYTGHPVSTFLGPSNWLTLLHPDDLERSAARWREAVATGEPYEIEYRLRRRDGGHRWFLGRALPVRDDAGRVEQWFGTCTDIHDLRLAQEEARAAREQAEQANKAKDHFLAVVSHELRTPLTPVLATASYLESAPNLPPDLRDDVATIRRNVEHEARIVDDLLSLTRLSRGKIVLHHETVDLHALLRAVLRQYQDRLDDRRIAVTVAPRARHHYAWADPGRVQQVLANLLDNALKFTPEDGRITLTTADDPDGALRVEIVDTGIGISPDVLPRLFNPFEQGETTVTRHFGGLGLGLAIARGIAELHGGSLTATSPGPGQGATFTLRLPTALCVTSPQPSTAAVSPATDGRARGHLRILLVEDHPDTLRVMSRLLKTFGHDVVTAATVAEAIRQLDGHAFDLLLSDIGLPDGSGLDVMRALRQRSATPGIALSGFGHDEDIRRSRDAGFADHLVKPVNLQALRSAIERFAH